MSCLVMDTASFDGIAKPMPMLPLDPDDEPPSWAIEELIPMSWPLALTSAPPELPGLMAADVWMALVTTVSELALVDPWPLLPEPNGYPCWPHGLCCCCWLSTVLVDTGRSRALTMPVVTVPARPSGLPIAMTGSPTLRAVESPRLIGVRSLGGLVSLRTARSVDASVPTIDAS